MTDSQLIEAINLQERIKTIRQAIVDLDDAEIILIGKEDESDDKKMIMFKLEDNFFPEHDQVQNSAIVFIGSLKQYYIEKLTKLENAFNFL